MKQDNELLDKTDVMYKLMAGVKDSTLCKKIRTRRNANKILFNINLT